MQTLFTMPTRCLTEEEQYFFGSFTDEFHGLKGIVLWFSNSTNFNYILVSAYENDLTGNQCFPLAINDLTSLEREDKNSIVEILQFLKKNKELIADYNSHIISDIEFIERVIK